MFIPHLTRWLELPGTAGSARPVWVTPRGVKPELAGLVRIDRSAGYYLVHDWFHDPDHFEAVQEMFVFHGGELHPNPCSVGDRIDPLVRAFDEERLWLWRVPVFAVAEPAVFPVEPGAGTGTAGTRLSWIEVVLLDPEGRPVPDMLYAVKLADGSTRQGRLNQAGYARLDGIPVGGCDVSFTTIDGREWGRQE